MKIKIRRRKISKLEQLVAPVVYDESIKRGDREVSELEITLLKSYLDEMYGKEE